MRQSLARNSAVVTACEPRWQRHGFGFLVAVIEAPRGRDRVPPWPTRSLPGDVLAGRLGLTAALAPAAGS